MEPWQSWAIVGVAGAGAYLYYARSKKSNRTRGRTSSLISQAQRQTSEVREESSKRRKKGKGAASSDRPASDAAEGSSQSVPTSGTENAKKRKSGNKGPSQLAQITATNEESNTTVEVPSEGYEDDGMDNKEFAKQLSSLKSGISLQKPVKNSEVKKGRKSGKQNESLSHPPNGKATMPVGGASSHEMSTASSTTGADADDDLSPTRSSVFGATEDIKHAGDVADMLEAPAKGPSVLRLTQPAQPQPERQPKGKQVIPEPETKKQRQNRQKNEEKKAAREEAEKQRRVLMEKQRRMAREAEGRPAKNGLGLSKPPTSSAWTKPAEGAAPVVAPAATASGSHLPLLDTFDEPVKTTPKTEVNGTTATQKTLNNDMPSEEEQLRMLGEMDDNGWNTVEKGGKSKKRKNFPPSDQVSETEGSKAESSVAGNSSDINVNGTARNTESYNSKGSGEKLQKPSTNGFAPSKSQDLKNQIDPKVWNQGNIHNHPDYDPEYPYALTGHPEDSDWAVV